MDRDFEIIKTQRCWFLPWDHYVTFKCLRDCQTIEQTLSGQRRIIAKKGYLYRVRLPKNYYRCPGALVDLEYLLPQAVNQNAIAWFWDYE
jgi:hypothetical protein